MSRALTAVVGAAILTPLILGGGMSASAVPLSTLNLWAISSTGTLYSIDPVSAAATQVGVGTGVPNPQAAALNPATGDVVVLDASCDLYSLDVTTGLATRLPFAITGTINNLPINRCDTMTISGEGVGYASVEAGQGSPFFVSFDPLTGTTTPLGPQMLAYYDWMAFDPASGNLYGQNDNTGDVYQMDPLTGVETFVSAFAPYSYSMIIADGGDFFANTYNDLAQGNISNWSGSVIAPFGAPVGSVGTNAMFTTTDVFRAAIRPSTQTVSGTQGVPLQATAAFTATHFSSPPTYSVSPGLPAGLSINPATGVISGTPTAPFLSSVFTVTASSGSTQASATITLQIAAAPTPIVAAPPPSLAATGAPSGGLLMLGISGGVLALAGMLLVWASRRRPASPVSHR